MVKQGVKGKLNKIDSNVLSQIMQMSKDELKHTIKNFKKEKNIGRMLKADLQNHLIHLVQNGKAKKRVKGAGIGEMFGVLGSIAENVFQDDVDEAEQARIEDQERAAKFEEDKAKYNRDRIQNEKDNKDGAYNMARQRDAISGIINQFKEQGIIKPKAKTFTTADAKQRTEQQRQARLEQERNAYLGNGKMCKCKN